jgi:mannose-6-phosphate isomerase-like protein (cupin superfamily)
MMGNRQDCLDYRQNVSPGFGIFVPAGTWHNVINTGRMPLKLFTVYAPPEHPRGTVHRTKAEAEEYHH